MWLLETYLGLLLTYWKHLHVTVRAVLAVLGPWPNSRRNLEFRPACPPVRVSWGRHSVCASLDQPWLRLVLGSTSC